MSKVAFPGEKADLQDQLVNAACETSVLWWVQKDPPQLEAGITLESSQIRVWMSSLLQADLCSS